MPWHRLVLVAGVAGLVVGMAVREPVLMAACADPAGIMPVAAIGPEMLAASGMADIADAIERSRHLRH